jgi:hypothetical protein
VIAQEKIVMLGPAEGRDPGIPDFGQAEKLVDARTKSAHDDKIDSERCTSATHFA